LFARRGKDADKDETMILKFDVNKVSADFMNNSGSLIYSRVEVAADARRRPVKLWSSTANGPQQSRCGEIGSPEGEKMPTYIK